MLEILIEEVAEALVDALDGRVRKIYTALSLLLCFGIFLLLY
jgi:TRAP-type C4-dicarboxylate transport system permease small subunit